MARVEPSALSGGVADKLGNRYEGWWTVWRGVVPVLRGLYDAITVEPIGEAGDGVEFRLSGRNPSGPDQVHQCKRRHSTSWTVNALRRQKLLDPMGRHLESGTEFVLVSEMHCPLGTLSEKARRLDVDAWQRTLTQSDTALVADLASEWGLAVSLHDRLRRFSHEGIADRTLRASVTDGLRTEVTGDPHDALLFLGDLLLDRLSTPLTAQDLWTALQEKGHRPREGYDHALFVTVQELRERYVDGVRRRRPANLALIGRPEIDHIVASLTDEGAPPGVVLTGPPGGGKSMVLAEVCDRLVAEGLVVGPVGLDAATASRTARELGAQEAIGFGGSPTAVVERAAAGRASVVVLDQLDALSRLTSYTEPVLDGIREVIESARASGAVRLLVACRRHDLLHDPGLSQLLGDLVRVDLGPLTEKQVRDALVELSIDPDGLSRRQRDLLASPFALRLLAEVRHDRTEESATGAEFDVTGVSNLTDLLRAFDEAMRRRLRSRIGADAYGAAVSAFARHLSSAGTLSVPRSGVSAPGPDTVDALIGEGVLVEEGGRIRFFHEEYFDYTFAEQHVHSGGTAAGLLDGDQQDLLRRRQICSVLAVRRESDAVGYLDDLRAVLARGAGRRSHIRSSVLTWLTSVRLASTQEYDLVAGLATDGQDPLAPLALRVLVSAGFVPHLLERGLAAAYVSSLETGDGYAPPMGGPLSGFDANKISYLLTEAARVSPEEVSDGLLPVARDPRTAVGSVSLLLWAVFLAGPDAGDRTVDLFQVATATISTAMEEATATPEADRQEPDREAINAAVRLFDTDGLHALSTLARRTGSAAALRAWVQARSRVARAFGGTGAFGYAGALPSQQTGLEIFQKVAERDPLGFLAELNALLLAEFWADGYSWYPTGASEEGAGLLSDPLVRVSGLPYDLEDEVISAWRTALQRAAAEHPVDAAPHLATLTNTDQRLAHELAAAAYSRCAIALHNEALAWASRPEVQGLPENGTVGWAWGAVLAHLSATGSAEIQDRVLDLASTRYADVDLGTSDGEGIRQTAPDAAGSLAVEQLVILSLIESGIGSRLPQPARARLDQSVEAFGPAPTSSGAWKGLSAQPNLGPNPEGWSDEEWIEAIEDHSRPSGQRPMAGSIVAANLPERLESAARSEPARFADLAITRLHADHDPRCAGAILRAVTETGEVLTADDLSWALRLFGVIAGWGLPAFNQPLCRLLGKRSSVHLPDSALTWIATIATSASDPTSSTEAIGPDQFVSSGLNSDRGFAAHTIAQLLGPAEHRETRLDHLRTAIEHLGTDHAGQVRAWTPLILTQVHAIDPPAAAAVAQQWMTRADDAQLLAPYLDRLVWRLLHTHCDLGVDLTRRMLNAAMPEARQRGGALAATASVFDTPSPETTAGQAIRTLFNDYLQDPEVRRGVAEALAVNVNDLGDDVRGHGSHSAANLGLLLRLLDDDIAAVREGAVGLVHHLRGPLTDHEGLLTEMAGTLAFREHPETVFHALTRATGKLPITATLQLCDTWLRTAGRTAGDIRTKDSAIAFTVTDVAFSLHAATQPGTDDRSRVLNTIDQLVDIGALDVDRRADEWASTSP